MSFMRLVYRKRFIQVTKCFKFVKNCGNKLHTLMFSVILYAYIHTHTHRYQALQKCAIVLKKLMSML